MTSWCAKLLVSTPTLPLTPFYAIYIQQGMDSNVASAFAMNSSGVVTYWSYDSDISGGNNSESRVTSGTCETSSIAFDLNDVDLNVIECNN